MSMRQERRGMSRMGFVRLAESGPFEWPWTSKHGLLVIRGAAGGGGGGGGGFCLEGLNLHGSDGGEGGGGGGPTSVVHEQGTYRAAGGGGGDGGNGGGIPEGRPEAGKPGRGCRHGDGGEGGRGGDVPPADGRIAANGGDGGRGFPGETVMVPLKDLSMGDHFEIEVGRGGVGGLGGEGFNNGTTGIDGPGGWVVFVSLLVGDEGVE